MSSEKEEAAFSEPKYALSDKPRTAYPWYSPSIDKYLVPETRKLLEEYSRIAPEDQSKHVHDIVGIPGRLLRLADAKFLFQRDQAWDIRSYPCTGLGVWLIPFISCSPAYQDILQRLRDDSNSRLIDIGCFLGSDLRRLAFDGARTENMYGIDIVSHWDVGFNLYRDQDSFRAHFIEADMLSVDETPALRALKGTVDVVSISAVFHQWDWKNQVEGAKRVALFTKGPGSLVVGHQIGNVNSKELINEALKLPQYRHNPESFAKLWDQVGAETGTEWTTSARLLNWEQMGWDPDDSRWMEPGVRVLDFVVTRVK